MSLYTVYQPIYRDNTIFAYEALLRGKYPPEQMFKMAEARGKSNELDILAMEMALQNYNYSQPMFINILPSTLQKRDVVEILKPILKSRKVILELTELEELVSIDLIRHKVNSIKSIGIQLALDDFGIGYNNLLTIEYLQPEFIKLDKNLIHNIVSPTVQSIIKSIVGLTHALNIKLIAEGVETVDQMHMLQSLGIQYFQGFYLGKPERLVPA